MLVLTRKTSDISYEGEILSNAFTQVLPIFTTKSPDEAMAELIANNVIKPETMWFASDDWNSREEKYFPSGAGKYEYAFVESPQTEKRITILGKVGFDNYYNDEYTRSGDAEFFAGMYPDIESASVAARDLMDKFLHGGFTEDDDVELSTKYEYSSGEGSYVSMKVIEIEVIA